MNDNTVFEPVGEERTAAPGMGDSIELRDEERTRCEVWVSEDRSSSGRTQPSERPAGMPDRNAAPGTGDSIELRDEERTRCEVWTRVMGYHRPVAAWNPGKRAEHRDRRYYIEPAAEAPVDCRRKSA